MSALQDRQEEYDLLSEKIHRLHMRRIIETDEAERFKLDKQIEEAETERHRIEQQLSGVEKLTVTCPYRGLLAFREQDTEWFCGREAYTEQLFTTVQHQSLVAVIGPSGSGKSSVVFAGLLPRLRQAPASLIAHFRPGGDPFYALASACVPLFDPEMGDTRQMLEIQELTTALSQAKLTVNDVVQRILQKNPLAQRVVLIGDQFEELYTVSEEDTQEHFLTNLLTVSQTAQPSTTFPPPCTLVLTLRADFLEQVLTSRNFAEALKKAILFLTPMSREELQEAIVGPAKKLDVDFESGLVERILDDVEQAPGRLPLLEFALSLLWEHQTEGTLTHAAYDAIKRVDGALASYADGVYARLSEGEQRRLRKILVQMVHPGEGTRDTRRLANRNDLDVQDWALVQKIATDRLVVTNRSSDEIETVEIVHESLIQNWHKLRDWMAEDRSFRTWQEGLRTLIHLWESSNFDKGVLLRGAMLAKAQYWFDSKKDEVSQREREFIEASFRLEKKEALRKRMIITAFMCIVCIGLAWMMPVSLTGLKTHLFFDLDTKNVSLTLRKDWSSRYQFVANELFIDNVAEMKADGLGLAFTIDPQRESGMIELQGEKLVISRLAFSKDAKIEIAANENDVMVFVKNASLVGEILVSKATMSLEMGNSMVEKAIHSEIPETITFKTAITGAVPVQFRLIEVEDWKLQGLQPQAISFEKEDPPHSGKFTSAIRSGVLTLQDIELSEELQESDYLRLRDPESRRLELSNTDKGTHVSFEGTVAEIFAGPKDFETNLTPTLFQYFYHQPGLKVFWVVVVFLFGFLTRIHSVIFSALTSKKK